MKEIKITNDFIDENDICHIIQWQEQDEVDIPTTIAYVDMLTGRVLYTAKDFLLSDYAKYMIAEAVDKANKAHPYTFKELEQAIKNVVEYETEEINGVGYQIAINNLSDMGIDEDMALFYGFPPEEE